MVTRMVIKGFYEHIQFERLNYTPEKHLIRYQLNPHYE